MLAIIQFPLSELHEGFHSQILKVSVSQVAFELSATLDFGLSLAPSLLLQKEAVRPDFLCGHCHREASCLSLPIDHRRAGHADVLDATEFQKHW